MMKLIRICLCCFAFALGGCSISFDRSEMPANPIPNLDQQRAINQQILKIAQTMKGTKAVEISEAGMNEAQSGPEQWTTCARVAFPSQSLYYTFFVRSDKVMDWRSSVLNDRCETRIYRSVTLGSSSSIY